MNKINLLIDFFLLDSYIIIIIELFEYNGSIILNDISYIIKLISITYFIRFT